MLANTSLSSIPVSMSAPVSISSSNVPTVSASDVPTVANVPVSAKASTKSPFDTSKILPSLDFDINMFKNLEEALKRLGGQIEFLNEKAEATFGQEKVNLLKQQIPLLKQQQKIQEQIAAGERSQNNELIYWLSNNGFKFDGLGNIENYNDKLLAMEQNVESLKKKYDDLNDVSGDEKNESAIKSAQKAYESANETLDKTKKYLEEYFATNNEEITEASKKWWEYENAIRDAEKTMRDLMNAQLENKIEHVGDQIEFLDAKLEHLDDNGKIENLNQQNQLYKEQQKLMHDLAEQMRGQLATLDKNSDEYVELQKEIIDLSTEWWELESAIKATNEEIKELERNKALEPAKNSVQEIEYLLDRYSDKLDLIDEQYKHATGAERVEYLTKKQQILNEQLVAQEEAYKRIHNLAGKLQNSLWQFGFELDENSLISNYDEVLNSLVGTEEYERAKEYADEYMEVVRGDLIDIQVEAYETKNALKEMAEEMQEALEEARQERLEPFKNTLVEVRYELDRVNDRLDLLDENSKFDVGTKKIEHLQQKIGLLNEKLEITQREFGALYELIGETQKDLWKYGFKLDENTLISNYDEVLNALTGTDQYENAKKVADEYMELMRDDYIENKLAVLETQNEIKEAYEEMLEATEKVEDELTDIIKKECEKRKDEIEKYTDERIKLLEKEKEAYRELRDEQDYKKSVNEQVEEIAKLNQQIETARRDTTIGGAQRLKELTEELREAQEELEEMTQDKIDSDYENNIDKEIERLEDQEENLLKNLEEKFSEENIGKMVAQAMSSGFIEINGEIKSLQEAMIESIDNSAKGYSVMANVIKSELITNLGIALETVRELDSVYSNLDIENFGSPNVNMHASATPVSGNTTKNITVGDTNITIQGSVDNATLEEIEQMIKESQDEMLQRIAQDL